MQQQQQTQTAWHVASQPDIVRAAQKDDLYLQQSIDACHDAVMRTFGAAFALHHAKSCRLIATFMYYATTTAAGLQTLGEEYCDIMQVAEQPTSSTRAQCSHELAPARTRTLLTLLQSLGPALLNRLAASLDRASEQGVLQGELDGLQFSNAAAAWDVDQAGVNVWDTSHPQDAAGVQHRHQQQEPCTSTPLQTWRHLVLSTRSMGRQAQGHIAPHWPAIKSWLLFAGRCHLAAFYLSGHYYEWSKRLLGVRYTSISANKEQRASYKFLGYMLVVQLIVSGVLQARSQLNSAQVLQDSLTQQGAGIGVASHSAHKHAVLIPDPEQCSPASSPDTAQEAATAAALRDDSADKQCPLCLSARSHATCPPCGHVFCWQCITQWCLEKPECPLCRTAVVSSQLVCLYHCDL